MDRSEMMSRIRSTNTLPERIVKMLLRRQKIRYVFQPRLPGNPDFLIRDFNCVVFVQGCFWHGCRRHYREPKSNAEFWRRKIEGNIERHARNARILEKMGYSVVEVWEHDLR